MILVALSLAVQLPFNEMLIIYILKIEFLLGLYQMGMSLLLLGNLKTPSKMLKIHFLLAITYLLSLLTIGVLVPNDFEWWKPLILVIPWGLAILFLVTIDELERARHYRL
jgi:hypothetical protein